MKRVTEYSVVYVHDFFFSLFFFPACDLCWLVMEAARECVLRGHSRTLGASFNLRYIWNLPNQTIHAFTLHHGLVSDANPDTQEVFRMVSANFLTET